MSSQAELLSMLNHDSRVDIEADQLRQLQQMMHRILPGNAFWSEKYSEIDFDPRELHSLDAFRQLPVVTKAELATDQEAHPPYGTNLSFSTDAYSRLHQTSGTTGKPMRWLDTPESWERMLRIWLEIYALAGVTSSDRMAFPFSFGPFLGFWAAFDGASNLGCLCLAGGGLSSAARIRQIVDLEATVVCCTPTYALRLAEVAEEEGVPLSESAVRLLIVAGEPGGNIPATRSRIENAWGATVIDHWGMTEIGPLGVEPVDRIGGLTLLEGHCIAEVVDPKTLERVPDGTTGELLITTLGRVGTPLIRYRTGDLVRASPESASNGRCLMHLEGGILGRADDMVIIRGNNVFPASIEAVVRRFPEVAEFQIVVRTVREMQHLTLRLEPVSEIDSDSTAEQLGERVHAAIKTNLNFHPDIEMVAAGSLPRFELKGRRFLREPDEN